ncbi:aryl-phospho-beta-glucosidase [Scopulibacillus darangshiensis]|uniref:Aryl-phospho-beta-glucosidase n=1 Tax=Scopulibacillus darangshiensis TaxID=442528 RepID=A0A4R2PAR4_9BACL|nr:glycoside hydrolase family 1 protein [Scopulibacillus darangshiensis]TCP30985.1 aryl-phospho-beta-glucosidase [Scopulibacillus darangshiensis]
MAKFYRFPKDFWWGSATSAEQTEGKGNTGKGVTNWEHWYAIEPNRFFNGVGPEITSDFFNQYKEDIRLLKETGHNSFRMSISWSRLIPDGFGEVNEAAVEFYNNVINELIQNNIKPFVGLFHFDMPYIMQERGGWESREVIDAYVHYAKVCFELFGDRVANWFTFNEPIVPVEGGYLYDFHYPNIVDFKRAAQVAFGTVLAHAKTVKAFKRLNLQSKIGIVLNLTPSYPRGNNEHDLKAANYADLFFNRSFLDPCVKGAYPQELIELLKEYDQLPVYTEEDLQIIKENTVQLLGVNYYQPRRVKAKMYKANEESPFLPEWFFDPYEMPGRKINPHRGWEIYEKGIYDILINLRDNYRNIECFISENGMGVENEQRFIENGQVNDHYRIQFIKGHLKYVHQALKEGSNVKGYHLWTAMDNWSWMNGYKNRYGLIRVDLDSMERSIKKSGEFFQELNDNNGFEMIKRK